MNTTAENKLRPYEEKRTEEKRKMTSNYAQKKRRGHILFEKKKKSLSVHGWNTLSISTSTRLWHHPNLSAYFYI